MSFSFEAKQELCKLPTQKPCCARAEAYGILLYCNTFHSAEVRIITENPEFAARLPKLFQRAFSLKFDRAPTGQSEGKLIFQITDREKIRHIIDILGYDPAQNLVLHVNFGILEDECCRAAFLRGIFLAGGSSTDPEKRYHLEFATSHQQASRELNALLRDMGFSPKNMVRNSYHITYFKQSEHIEDFLTLIGSPVAAMAVMSAKVEKELRNRINRRLNCDNANVDKTVEAAQEQVEAIRRLIAAGIMNQLPDKLQLTAALRVENPELTMMELSEEFDPPVTKSCLNHRLRKLLELARGL